MQKASAQHSNSNSETPALSHSGSQELQPSERAGRDHAPHSVELDQHLGVHHQDAHGQAHAALQTVPGSPLSPIRDGKAQSLWRQALIKLKHGRKKPPSAGKAGDAKAKAGDASAADVDGAEQATDEFAPPEIITPTAADGKDSAGRPHSVKLKRRNTGAGNASLTVPSSSSLSHKKKGSRKKRRGHRKHKLFSRVGELPSAVRCQCLVGSEVWTAEREGRIVIRDVRSGDVRTSFDPQSMAWCERVSTLLRLV